jgi:hypothetical protein
VDLEKATKKAWRAFRNELADRLSGLAPHQSISVGVESAVVDDPSSGTAPYVQFARGNGDLVRAEVSGNQYLHSAHRLSKVGRRSLAALGWSRPMPKLGRFNFEFDADTSHADQLAALTVVTLREVFAVPHPAFLTGDVAIAEDRDLPQVEPNETRDEALAVMPESRLHLEQLVDLALATSLGHAPNRDEDGDIPIVSGTAVVFVRVLPDRPLVRIWSEVVVEITDEERASFEVGVLNRDRPLTKFQLAGDRIIAQIHLPAAPFVPAHLRETISMMCDLADEIDDDLAVRVSGRRFLEPRDLADEGFVLEQDDDQEEVEDLHPAMLTLLQLDADQPGSIKPALAARVCDYDPELLLNLIRWNEEQELAWRSSADAARLEDDSDDEAEVCDHEADHAKRTVKLLRKALRLVIESDRGDLEATSVHRRSPRQPRRGSGLG